MIIYSRELANLEKIINFKIQLIKEKFIDHKN